MNLVIIVSDTFRWDYIGAYGNEWIKTPNLDKLAAESAIFMDAYAEGLPTIPVRRVLMTGRPIFPFVHHPQPSDSVQLPGWHPLFDEDVTLSETLREHDYVSCFVNDVYHMMKPGKNFHRGFDCWYWIRGQEGDPYALRDERRVADLLKEATPYQRQVGRAAWIVQHLMNRKDWKTDADTSVAQCMRKAAEWLRDYTLDNPFYLHVECFDPHEPWDPPLEYAREYDADYSGLDGLVPPGLTSQMTEQQASHTKTAYAAEVTLVDRWVGHLLDTLRDLGRMDDTLIVFTSDHGCMMGEQGQVHKGQDRLRNQCTQLPLFIRHPRGEAAGKRVHGFVQHQDIMSTALALMGIQGPDRMLGANVWPLATGATSEAPRDTVVSAFGRFACVRNAKWNYVTPWMELPEGQQKGPELYDLEADPEELTNIVADHPAEAKKLHEQLAAHMAEYAPITQGSLGPGTTVAADTSELMSFDALPALEADRS
ncbi:MAG: sulfatase [Armatimonadota bacterium]